MQCREEKKDGEIFSSTYLYEQVFSALKTIKIKTELTLILFSF